MTAARVLAFVWQIAMVFGIVAFGGVVAHAQSEVDPDHFDSPNTEPVRQPKLAPETKAVTTHYNGKFTLPYIVQCNGKSLPPGEYSFSLHWDGKTAQAIVNSKDQSVGIVGIVHQLPRKARRDALIVENKRNSRTLSIIRVAELDFVLAPQQQVGSASNAKHGVIESLPVILARKDQN